MDGAQAGGPAGQPMGRRGREGGREGRAFLRFDYSGHGESDGAFEDGCIGDWHEDTVAAVDALTEGPVVVVGS